MTRRNPGQWGRNSVELPMRARLPWLMYQQRGHVFWFEGASKANMGYKVELQVCL